MCHAVLLKEWSLFLTSNCVRLEQRTEVRLSARGKIPWRGWKELGDCGGEAFRDGKTYYMCLYSMSIQLRCKYLMTIVQKNCWQLIVYTAML